MAYQSLYRRYRSRTFAEVVGQPHVTTGLRSAVAEGRQSHAYLFSGPRGTGKTSTARVLAKALNCDNLAEGEPCGKCPSCVAIDAGTSFDLHELDAASHNKVDDMRELISKVQLGSPGRTKVYILDEVHMLSSGAENALLKTLEEPPAHVVFVLATTEPHKVVPTIRSRTQHFQFHLLPADELAAHVRWVVADAKLDVDDEAIEYALLQGGGSARDTLSALDLVAAAGGVPAGTDVAQALARAIGTSDPAKAIATVQTGLELGREPRTIGEETLELLRNAFLASMGAPLGHLNDTTQALSQELAKELGPATLTRALEAIGQTLVEMRQAPDPRVPLEVTLLRLTRKDSTDPAALAARIEQLEQQVAELRAGQVTQPGQVTERDTPEPSPAADTEASPARSTGPPRAPRSPRRRAAQAPESGASPQPASTDDSETPTATATSGGPTSTSGPPTSTVASGGSEAAPAIDRSSAEARSSGAAQSLAAVTDALATQLDGVSRGVRARFRSGRVVNVEAGVVRFAVPNAIHRDRCADVKGDVEQALSAHFGQPIELEIVVDDASTPPIDPAKLESEPASRQHDDSDDDVGPVTELDDATDQSATGIERIVRAFPGSAVVDAPPD